MTGPIAFLVALLLGFVEGLTEFLPVSSTAHLILLGAVLGFEDPTGAFKVMIQLGAILAIVFVFIKKIWETIVALPTQAQARRFALSVFVAFLPAAFAGVLLGDVIERVFLEGQAGPQPARIIAIALILGGIVMLLVERFRPIATDHAADQLPLWKSLAVGACQTMALIPGVSRSGATIIGAMLLGVERRAAAEFSFYLAMPTMLGAFAYSFYKNRETLLSGGGDELALIAVGFVGAFLAGLVVVRVFLGIVSKYGFAPFAFYRIALGAAILVAAGFGAFGAG